MYILMLTMTWCIQGVRERSSVCLLTTLTVSSHHRQGEGSYDPDRGAREEGGDRQTVTLASRQLQHGSELGGGGVLLYEFMI